MAKLTYIINNFNRGGAEMGLLHLWKYGFFEGIELEIIGLFKGSGVLLPLLEKAGAPTPQILIDKDKMSLQGLWKAYGLLKQRLRATQADYAIGSLPQANILMRHALKNSTTKIISFEHNTRYAKPYYGWLLKQSSASVYAVFYDTPATASFASDYYKHPKKPKWFEVPLVAFEEQAIPPRKQAISLLSAGRLTTVKNHQVVIKALHQLKQKGVTPQYTLLGEGPEEELLNTLIAQYRLEDQVRILPFADDWQPYRLENHLYLQPSTEEGLCIVALEAMADEMCVIGSSTGGMAEYGEHGENIWLTSAPPDTRELAEAIETLMTNAELRERIARNARKTALKQFGAAKIRDELAQIREELTRT